MSNKIVASLGILLLVIVSFFISIDPANAEIYTIEMGTDKGQLKFFPETLTIQPGDTVRWRNNKFAPHNAIFYGDKIPTIVAKELSHQDLLFSTGQYYETTFPKDSEPGEYPYYCRPHRGAGMQGKIIVNN